MVKALKVLISCVFVFMCYEVVDTSLKSNLFKEWDYLAGIPWMRATIFDFYANVFVISIWICYKESKVLSRILWVLSLVLFGSIATCAYVLIQLFKMKAGDSLTTLFSKSE